MRTNRVLALAVAASVAVLLSAATAFSELVPGVPEDMRMPRVAVFVILAFAVAINGAITSGPWRRLWLRSGGGCRNDYRTADG